MNTEVNTHETQRRKAVWMRGLFMLIFMLLVNFAATVLAVVAVVQFFWLLINGEENHGLTKFGRALGKWFSQVIAYQTLNSEEKAFPWAAWPSEDS